MTAEAPVLSGATTLDRAWELAPQVSVRPEAFGALLYHFGTRRLSFLKDRRLLGVVQHLGDAPTARDACLDAGVASDELAAFATAIDRLVATDMLRERRRAEDPAERRRAEDPECAP